MDTDVIEKPKTEQPPEVKKKPKTSRPKKYQVVMHFAKGGRFPPCTACVLKNVFKLSAEEAGSKIFEASFMGKASVMVDTPEICETKALAARNFRSCFPIRPYAGFTAEPL